MTAGGPIDFERQGAGGRMARPLRSQARPDYECSFAGIARICANDVQEASEQIRDWRLELTQLERGPAHVSGIMVPLGNTLVGRVHCSRALYSRGAAPNDSVSFLFNGSSIPGRAGSLTLDANACIVYGSAAELNNYSARDMVAVAVSVSRSKWLEVQAAFQFNFACGDGQSQFLATSPQCIRSMVALLNAVCTAIEEGRHGFSDPKRSTAFEDSALAIVASMLGAPRKSEAPIRKRPGRYRAVTRAQEFIHENLGEPLSLLRLCDASLASARTLEYGFRELFGVPPLTYVRFERLGRVHRELHQANRTGASVTDVAMRWGFWHLGQFSKEYRGLFGECPSTTLSRARFKSSQASLATANASSSAN